MPYIGINLTGTLTDEQKLAIKRGLGERITVIPGKSEAALMVDISENHTLFLGGDQRPLAFVDVRCYGTTEFEYKKAFTEAAFEVMEKAVGLTERDIYLTYAEYPNWGTRGSMK